MFRTLASRAASIACALILALSALALLATCYVVGSEPTAASASPLATPAPAASAPALKDSPAPKITQAPAPAASASPAPKTTPAAPAPKIAPAPAPAATPTGCAFQGNLNCADSVQTLLADDAFNVYASGSEFSYSETLAGFQATYVGAITASEKYNHETQLAIPSQTFPHIFYVFNYSIAK